jgi:hypothetical protein
MNWRRAALTYFAVGAVGMVLGYVLRISPSIRMSLLLGGGMSLPLAFLAAAWPLRRKPVRDALSPEEQAFVLFLAGLCILLTLVVWFDDFPAEQAKFARVRAFRTLDPSSVTGIRVFEVRSRREFVVDDPDAIRAFVTSFRDMENGARGSSSGRRIWAVQFYGERPWLLELVEPPRGNTRMGGRFLVGEWGPAKCRISYLGSFRVRSLMEWFGRYAAE